MSEKSHYSKRGAPRMGRSVSDRCYRSCLRRSFTTRQQRFQRRHDRHRFKNRAADYARWHASASLCGREPMPV